MKQLPKRLQTGLVVGGLLAIVAGVYLLMQQSGPPPSLLPENQVTTTRSETPTSTTPTVSEMVIGSSVQGRSITAYQFGDGQQHLLFVGGIHGGYEWNSVVLAYRFMRYLRNNPGAIPENLKVTVIPSANPDAVYAVAGTSKRFSAADIPATADPGGPERFNANGVDLNRNFDCNWQPESFWRGEPVNAGTAAFSEPEAQALRDFVQLDNPTAVISWHSQASAVYGSQCNNGILPETLDIMNTYAQAAGYRAVRSFDAYPITGDMEGWLAKLGIPAVTVELSSHQAVEWEKNLAGVEAIFEYYSGGQKGG